MTTFIRDKDGNQANASGTTVPSDRHFRSAWSLSGTVITEDLTAAKVIFKDKIREVRIPLLAAQDVAFMKALEDDGSTGKRKRTQHQVLSMGPRKVEKTKKKKQG